MRKTFFNAFTVLLFIGMFAGAAFSQETAFIEEDLATQVLQEEANKIELQLESMQTWQPDYKLHEFNLKYHLKMKAAIAELGFNTGEALEYTTILYSMGDMDENDYRENRFSSPTLSWLHFEIKRKLVK